MDTQLLQAAEVILQAKLGEALPLDAVGSDRAYVWRVFVEDAETDLPESVIIKQERSPENKEHRAHARQRFIRERTALEFLTNVFDGNLPAPRYYGTSSTHLFVIMEDIRNGVGFQHALLGDDRQTAETGLLALAKALGQLHARTAGRAAEFDQIHQTLGPIVGTPMDVFEGNWRKLFELTEQTMTATMLSDLEQLKQEPERASVLTHGDICSDNILLVGDTVKLVDFEGSGMHDAGYDAAYFRMPFPTCWCASALTDDLVQRCERTYRDELLTAFPEMSEDEIFYTMIARGMGVMLSFVLLYYVNSARNNLKFEKFPESTLSTARERLVLRLETFADITRQVKIYEALGAASMEAAQNLRKRWDIDTIPLFRALTL